MAQKRMFTMKIVDSDAFLDMPLSTQCLYFHLNMRADDDGFIGNPKKIMRMIGASEDDLKILLAKRFLIIFEDSVVVVKHWWMHNTLAKDRYHETSYTDEKALLRIKENKAYTLGPDGQEIKQIENVNKMLTECNQNVNSDLDIDIVLDKEKEQEEIPPAYIPKTEYKDCNKALEEIHKLILSHNEKQTENKKKIGICKDFFNFSQNEARSFTELFKRANPVEVIEALKNYLLVASADVYISSFSINAFCKNFNNYTAEYFDMTRYIDMPKGGLNQLVEERMNADFDNGCTYRISTFVYHKKEWFNMGMPKGKELEAIVKHWLSEDEKNGVDYSALNDDYYDYIKGAKK